MDRLTFFNSISGIKYPEMLVEFYDQFLALSQLLWNRPCAIVVIDNSGKSISFSINYKDDPDLPSYLSNFRYHVVYGRSIGIYSEVLSDCELKLTLS